MTDKVDDISLPGRLARYMAEARGRDLPAKVAREAKNHILDTVAAMVSGASLFSAVRESSSR